EKGGFTFVNSDFLNGLDYKAGTAKVIEELEKIGAGKSKVNYRLRDAVFSRQRYWGEPFPVYYVNGLPQMIDPKYLPIRLPEVEKYLPTEDGQPPLGNATVWAWDTVNNQVVENSKIDHKTVFPLELNTMPGWAGSSWYWMRYMDAHNDAEFASKEALDYWQNVDLYIGGSEHATGHLLYSRFWNKFLKDRGFAPTEEPFKKLINQGMILGMSAFAYKITNMQDFSNSLAAKFDDFDKEKGVFISKEVNVNNEKLNEFIKKHNDNIFISYDEIKKHPFSNIIPNQGEGSLHTNYNEIKEILKNRFPDFSEEIEYISFNVIKTHVDLSCINDVTNELDIEKFKAHPLYQDYKDAEFILDENGKYIVGREVEKMSKSKYNEIGRAHV